MSTPSLLQQALEQLDFNQLQPIDNPLKNTLQKINKDIKQSSPNLLQTLLHQTFTQLNHSSESTPILEAALEILNRGIIGKEIPLDDSIVDEELPTLPDLEEDVLATETMPLENLFVLAKNSYKEPRSFVLEKAATETEIESAVITIDPVITVDRIKPQIRPIISTPTPVVKPPVLSTKDQANHFFANLPYEKALPRIKVIEQDTGEETHFHILPGKQNPWKTENNTTENPLFAATLQAVQTSGGKIPTQLNKTDYNTTKSRAFFSALPW